MMFDAVVIGGGPAGSTIALLLARAGWSVALVEKKIFPRRKVCGEFISATSLPLLNEVGIGDFYLSHSGPEIDKVGLFAVDTILTSPMPESNIISAKWGRALGREHLDFKLLEVAAKAGAKIWQPWNALDLKGNIADGFTCTIENKLQVEKISARIAIMAYGSWERDLLQLHPKHAHKPNDLLAFKAHFRNFHLSDNLMPMMVFPGGYGGLVRSDDERLSFSCCIRRDILNQARKKYPGQSAGAAVLQHIKTACLGVRQILEGAELEAQWLSTGPLRIGIRQCYKDGIFFVGNIAGESHPIIAEGISMAMQSSWLLSKVLISKKNILDSENAVSIAGAEYTKYWRAQFSKRIHASSVFAQLAARPLAVSLLLPLFRQFPEILTYGAKLSGKVQQIIV